MNARLPTNGRRQSASPPSQRVLIRCKCGAKLRSKAKHIGKHVDCPKCGAEVSIPPLPPPVVISQRATSADSPQPVYATTAKKRRQKWSNQKLAAASLVSITLVAAIVGGATLYADASTGPITIGTWRTTEYLPGGGQLGSVGIGLTDESRQRGYVFVVVEGKVDAHAAAKYKGGKWRVAIEAEDFRMIDSECEFYPAKGLKSDHGWHMRSHTRQAPRLSPGQREQFGACFLVKSKTVAAGNLRLQWKDNPPIPLANNDRDQ